MADGTDSMDGLTPIQAAQDHVRTARRLLRELEAQNGSRWKADQIIAIAQVHATLAVAAATVNHG